MMLSYNNYKNKFRILYSTIFGALSVIFYSGLTDDTGFGSNIILMLYEWALIYDILSMVAKRKVYLQDLAERLCVLYYVEFALFCNCYRYLAIFLIRNDLTAITVVATPSNRKGRKLILKYQLALQVFYRIPNVIIAMWYAPNAIPIIGIIAIEIRKVCIIANSL